MTDTKDLFRPLDTVETPALWERIEGDASRSTRSMRSPLRTVVLAAASIGITGMLAALLLVSFRSGPSEPGPAIDAPPTHVAVRDVKLGDPRTIGIVDRGGLAAGREAYGSLWTIRGVEGVEQLQRRDPQTGEVERTFDLPVVAGSEWGGEGIEVGLDRVWVRAWDSATIYGIDPDTNEVTTYPVEGRYVSDVAVDPRGWVLAFVSLKGDAGTQIVKLDPATGQVSMQGSFQAQWSSGLLSVADAIWTLEREIDHSTVQGGSLVQISPGSAPPVVTGGSFALPVADESSIWTPFSGDPKVMNLASGIAQVDPETGEVVGQWETDPVGYDIAIGDDGGVWFLAGGGLERLDPNSGDVDITQQIDGTPVFIEPSPDGVWVGTYEGSMLFFPFELTSTSPRTIEVPDLVGLSDQRAARTLDRLGLMWVGAYREVEGVDRWHVAETDPIAGTGVEPGTDVRLVVATNVTPLPVGAANALDCDPDLREAFGGPKLRFLPGGSAYIVGNVAGIDLKDDRVTQVTFEAEPWHGIWHVIRDGSVIAVVDFLTLDGVACIGSGVAAA